MFDTIYLKLPTKEAGVGNAVQHIAPLLSGVGLHRFSDGGVSLSGNLGCLSVSVSDYSISIFKGSLCKWYLGDNFQALGKRDYRDAIENLSDALHLPMEKANVSRVDVANNIILKYPVEVYLQHLGRCAYYTRIEQPTAIEYRQKGREKEASFYDKVREQKARHNDIPELYQGRNVLRFEYRHLSRLCKQFNVPVVQASTLYEDGFYSQIIQHWMDFYKSIHKEKETEINMDNMKGVKDLQRLGILALIEKAGSEQALLEQVQMEQKKGLDRKAAQDIRNAIKRAVRTDDVLTIESEAVKELDTKIKDTAKMYG